MSLPALAFSRRTFLRSGALAAGAGLVSWSGLPLERAWSEDLPPRSDFDELYTQEVDQAITEYCAGRPDRAGIKLCNPNADVP